MPPSEEPALYWSAAIGHVTHLKPESMGHLTLGQMEEARQTTERFLRARSKGR